MIFLRIIVYWALLSSLNYTYNLSINAGGAALFLGLGTITFKVLDKPYLKVPGKIVLGLIFLCTALFLTQLFLYLSDFINSSFAWYSKSTWFFAIFYSYGFASAAIVAGFKGYLLLEGFLFLVFVFLSLESIRGLNFSSSKFIHDWSTFLDLTEMNFTVFFATLLIVLYVVGLLFGANLKLSWKNAFFWALLGFFISAIASQIILFMYQDVGSHPMGVGFDQSEDGSQLSFDSFVGSSQQATALVKLGSNYFDRRTSPIIYFREGAVSKFNGRELVKSDFDVDIPKNSPAAPQELSIFDELRSLRIDVTYKVYLLISHLRPFGIDIPVKFTPITNPNPEKFTGGSYETLSWAPLFTDLELALKMVGGRFWTNQEWEHYTEKHTDSRYEEKARQIVGDETRPLNQIFKLIEHINKNYIYTVKPNHNVPKTADPVAPFLFGDKRGYCVHIAHALVYMMRGLGIPSRIGLGYASDLTDSRDGYILLRMNDRHAWAEVYFDGVGWVVFDAQPEKVESHRTAPVDQNLLKSLIEDIERDDFSGNDIQNQKSKSKVSFPIWLASFTVVLIYVILKAYLWFGWLVFRTKKHLVLSVLSKLYDIGYERKQFQTLDEFINSVNTDSTEEILKIFFKPVGETRIPKLRTNIFHFLKPNSLIRHFVVGKW